MNDRGTSEEPLDISVTLATAGEADVIEAMAQRIWRSCYVDLLSPQQIDYMLEWMYQPSRIREEICHQGIEYRWLRLDGEVVGFSASGPGEEDGEHHIHKLYVLRDRQGLGVGSAGLRVIEDAARAAGASKLSLRVNRANHGAIRAYERNGFERAAEVCSDIGGGFVMDDYVMVKRLD